MNTLSRKTPPQITPTALWTDIRRFADPAQISVLENELRGIKTSLTDTIIAHPETYDVTHRDQVAGVVSERYAPLEVDYLYQKVLGLRSLAGYIQIKGYWVHRALLTFCLFGLVAIPLALFCLVEIFSTTAWHWLFGLAGLLALGIITWIIFKRIKD